MPPEAALAHGLSHDEYFRLEQEQDQRYEYLAGEVFAMAGGSERHALISMNVGAALVNATRDKPCRVYGADMKLHVAAHDHFCYPDVMLLCEQGRRHERHVENPILIVEVLSPTTQAYDRGLKFEHYRSIEGLGYYLLIDQDRPHVELFERLTDGGWRLSEATGTDGHIGITGLGVELSLAEVYRQVEWPATPPTEWPIEPQSDDPAAKP
jgi:Uma2 family endonuclease